MTDGMENSPMTPLDEFELLMALRLSDEISPAEEQRLRAIVSADPALRAAMERYLETQQFVSKGLRSPDAALLPARPAPSVSPPANRLRAVLSAAAALVVAASIFYYTQRPNPWSFEARGGCDSIEGTLTVRTKDSTCDVRNGNDHLAIRLLPNSEIQANPSGPDLIIQFRGRISVDAQKGKRPIVFASGEQSVRILGTHVVLTSEEGVFRAEMIQGSAEVRGGKNSPAAVITDGKYVEIKTGEGNAPEKPEIREIPADRLWLLNRWSTSMDGSLPPEKITELTRMETPGIIYSVRLKDGRVLVGPVHQSEKSYRIQTTNGEFDIPSDQVDSIDVSQ